MQKNCVLWPFSPSLDQNKASVFTIVITSPPSCFCKCPFLLAWLNVSQGPRMGFTSHLKNEERWGKTPPCQILFKKCCLLCIRHSAQSWAREVNKDTVFALKKLTVWCEIQISRSLIAEHHDNKWISSTVDEPKSDCEFRNGFLEVSFWKQLGISEINHIYPCVYGYMFCVCVCAHVCVVLYENKWQNIPSRIKLKFGKQKDKLF